MLTLHWQLRNTVTAICHSICFAGRQRDTDTDANAHGNCRMPCARLHLAARQPDSEADFQHVHDCGDSIAELGRTYASLRLVPSTACSFAKVNISALLQPYLCACCNLLVEQLVTPVSPGCWSSLHQPRKLSPTSICPCVQGQCPNAFAYVLCGNPDITREIHMRADRKYPITVGNVDCRLLKYKILPPKSVDS